MKEKTLPLNTIVKKIRGFWEKGIVYRVFVKKHKRYFIMGTLALIAVDIVNIFPPLIIKKAIDILSKETSLKKILTLSLLFMVVSFFQGVCRYLWRINFIGTSFRCDYDLRMAFFQHIETLSQRFFQKYKTGDLMSRATNDIGAIRMAVGPGLLIGLDSIFYFFLVPPIILYLSPKLSFYTFLLMPVTPFIAYKIKDVIDKRFRDVQELFSKISEKVQENTSGIRIVKSFNMSRQAESSILKLCKEYMKKNLSLAIPQSLLGPIFEYITYTGIIILLFIGGKMVIEGAITLGTLVAFQRYISMMVWPMTAIGWCLSLLQRGNASMKRIDEVMDERPETVSRGNRELQSDNPITLLTSSPPQPNFAEEEGKNRVNTAVVKAKHHTLKGEIEFRDIHFRYEGHEEWILKGINLKIPAGQQVALVGHIGSGKSTLVNMLPRIIPVSDQGIFLDGIDINTIDIKILRQHIGFVPQDTFLFSDRIEDNILFGAENGAQSCGVQELARMAGIEKEIQELPHKFKSYLGERGINLSGGQKQRITIARALAIDPRIIILDDCLSAVDARVEDTIMKNIAKTFPGRTLLVVTHRLPAIRNFDLIVVLKDGMIAEKGTHEQLMKVKGLYTSLYTKEALEENIEAENLGN